MSQPSPGDVPPPNESLELKLPHEAVTPKDLSLWAGVLVLLALVVYWPATSGGFLFRDDAAVSQNPALFLPGGLSQIWTGRWDTPARYPAAAYQPVAFTAYWLEFRLGGHDEQGVTPAVFHIATVLFHAVAVVLLWLTLRELKVPAGWVVAAVFALHPVNAEAVCWIANQSIPLAGMFLFGAWYAYLRYVTYREQDLAEKAAGGRGVDPATTWGLYATAFGLSVLADLSNPAAVVLPVAVVASLWWRRRFTSTDMLLLTPLLILGLLGWLANFELPHTLPGPVGSQSVANLPPLGKLAAVGSGLWTVAGLSIVPTGLVILRPTLLPPGPLAVVPLLAALVLLLALVTVVRRRGLGAVAAALVYLAAVFFSLNWFDPARASAVTDAAAYFAVAPLWAVLVGSLLIAARLYRPAGLSVQVVVGLTSALLLVLGVTAWSRAHTFDSPVSLWQDTAKKRPNSPIAHALLAEWLRRRAADERATNDRNAAQRDDDAAVAEVQTALSLNPATAIAERTWANVLSGQGQAAQSLPHYQAAVALAPAVPDTHVEYASNLIVLGGEDNFRKAVRQLDEALKYQQQAPTTHQLLGEAYAALGDRARAIGEENRAVEEDQTNLPAYQILAEQLAKVDDKDPNRDEIFRQAIEAYSNILKDPAGQRRPKIWTAIADIKIRQKDYDAAYTYLQTALKLAPGDDDITKQLAGIKGKTHPATTQAATRGS